MQPYNVIIKPVLSEKSTDLRERHGQYVFEVVKTATKIDISNAISKLWGVKVAKVTTTVRRTKIKKRGAVLSKPRLSKVAYITLNSGEKLPLFEEQ